MTRLEAACDLVGRLYVNTNTPRIMSDEPSGQATKEFRRDATPPVLRPDRNPLQLSLTTEAARQMPCNQAYDAFSFDTNEGHAGT